MNSRVSYWLMPAEPDQEQLTATIRRLATPVGGPIFQPHVTLYSGPVEARERLDAILQEATGGFHAIVLNSRGLKHSEQFTKTLFMEFDDNDALELLAAKLKQLSAQPEDYQLNPHLSLVYASMDWARRRALAESVAIPKAVRFDSLKAMLTGSTTGSRGDVESWRMLAEQRLR